MRRSSCDGARRRPARKLRRGRPTRQSGEQGPSPSSRRRRDGGGSRCRQGLRWRRRCERRKFMGLLLAQIDAGSKVRPRSGRLSGGPPTVAARAFSGSSLSPRGSRLSVRVRPASRQRLSIGGRAWIHSTNAASFGRPSNAPTRAPAASSGKLMITSAEVNSSPANHGLLLSSASTKSNWSLRFGAT